MLEGLRSNALPNLSDLEVAVPLATLLHDELERYGTDGSQVLAEAGMRTSLLALKAVIARLNLTNIEIPFRDFGSFRTYWSRNNAYGSWQARRNLLSDIFGPIHEQLAARENASRAASLAEPVSSHLNVGWPEIDEEVDELRRHFRNAQTAQDYRAVGLDCIAVTEALSAKVYEASRHLRDGELEPPISNTKQRLERFVEVEAQGADNAALRKLARAVIEFSQQVKHSGTPTRMEAGIAADGVILLANMLRRLDERRTT